MSADCFNSCDHAGFKLSMGKRAFHLTADAFPFVVCYPGVDPPVRYDFNITVCKQQINQNAVVLFGIPDAKMGKYVYGALPSGLTLKQGLCTQGCLHGETYFPCMAGFRSFNSFFDRCHGRLRKRSSYGHKTRAEMTRYSGEIQSPSPRCTATTEAAATPAEAASAKAATPSPASETAAVPSATTAVVHTAPWISKQAHKESKNSNNHTRDHGREKKPA